MVKVVLANIDYKNHMTDEGDQLQEGLKHAGWILSGYGYDGLTDVNQTLEKYKPDVVFVQDKRDWDKTNKGGCFNPAVSFENITSLKSFKGKVVSVVKDAGTMVDYQQNFIENEIDADVVVTYYHDLSILGRSPFLKTRKRVRTYHSIDSSIIPSTQVKSKNCIISGALNKHVYPLREKIVFNARRFGVDVYKHPGYNNSGCKVNTYLNTLSEYKVSIATCSAYNFALRKIIESVACSCYCLTNLPKYDVLPGIDQYLGRFYSMENQSIKDTISKSVVSYNINSANKASELCKEFYDFKALGIRLDQEILNNV
jgi:hypothetical protein